jgi:hypothetical protein
MQDARIQDAGSPWEQLSILAGGSAAGVSSCIMDPVS